MYCYQVSEYIVHLWPYTLHPAPFIDNKLFIYKANELENKQGNMGDNDTI